jgi:hypothetical protein
MRGRRASQSGARVTQPCEANLKRLTTRLFSHRESFFD